MRAIHLSRAGIEAFEPPSDCVVVSITDPHSAPADIPDNPRILAVHRVDPFHDIDREIPNAPGLADYVAFDRLRADAIAWFLRAHPNVPLVAVHCEAGISRSAGVCAAIQQHYGLQLGQTAFKTGIPNRLVYRLTLEALEATR